MIVVRKIVIIRVKPTSSENIDEMQKLKEETNYTISRWRNETGVCIHECDDETLVFNIIKRGNGSTQTISIISDVHEKLCELEPGNIVKFGNQYRKYISTKIDDNDIKILTRSLITGKEDYSRLNMRPMKVYTLSDKVKLGVKAKSDEYKAKVVNLQKTINGIISKKATTDIDKVNNVRVNHLTARYGGTFTKKSETR